MILLKKNKIFPVVLLLKKASFFPEHRERSVQRQIFPWSLMSQPKLLVFFGSSNVHASVLFLLQILFMPLCSGKRDERKGAIGGNRKTERSIKPTDAT